MIKPFLLHYAIEKSVPPATVVPIYNPILEEIEGQLNSLLVPTQITEVHAEQTDR